MKITKNETKQIFKKYTTPLVAFVVFMLPIVNSAIQIDLAGSTFPTHWRMVISAAFGGGIATLITLFKKLYELEKVDLDKQVAGLQRKVQENVLEREIAEKNLMLNSAMYNEEWLISNANAEDLQKIVDQIKKRKIEDSKPKIKPKIEEKK